MSDEPLTLLMHRIDRGERDAAAELLPLVYGELRKLAAARMARERSGHTLQPTALVHEAWLRLGGDQQPGWKSRAQFFAAAAEAMRRILIDRARRRLAQRRGGGAERVNPDDLELAAAQEDTRIVELGEALENLAAEDPAKAELVKLRYFAGLKVEDAAEALGISEPTARRWWAYARARLLRDLTGPGPRGVRTPLWQKNPL